MFTQRNNEGRGGSNAPRGRGRGNKYMGRKHGDGSNAIPHNNNNNNNNKNHNPNAGNQKNVPKHRNKQWTRPGLQQDHDISSMQPPAMSSKNTSTAEQRLKRFGDTDKSILYTQMKEDRVIERREAIRTGQIADPDVPRRLEDAIDFRGTCQSMCPAFEIVEREVQNMLDPLEVDAFGNADPNKAVKRYRRSAAGNEQPLPSDVRPPAVLTKTLDYLFNNVLSNNQFISCHAFLWDRTRGVRQDFTLQNIRNVVTVQVHERIARFHILALHELCEYDEDKFSQQQETEQLGKVLISLMEFYNDLRQENIHLPNEGEFRAYHLIYNIRDHELASRMMTMLPEYVRQHPYLRQAFRFYESIQRNNEIMQTSERRNKPENVLAAKNYYAKLFKLVGSSETPFLLACMIETHFAEIRKGALKAMSRAYIFNYKGVDSEYLRQLLAYDDVKHFLVEANLYGLVIEKTDNTVLVRFGQKIKGKTTLFVEPLSLPRQRRSCLLVDPKKGGRSYSDIINSDANSELHISTSVTVRDLQHPPLANVETKNTTFLSGKRTLLPTNVVTDFPVVRRIVNATPTLSAEELAERERKRAETQQQQLRQAALLQQRQRQQKQEAAMQAQLRAEQERKQKEAAAAAAAAAAAETAHRLKQQREAQERAAIAERQQREAMLAELTNSLGAEVFNATVLEEVQVVATSTLHQYKDLKRNMQPLLNRTRTRITYNQRLAKERGCLHRLVDRLSKRILKPACKAVKAQRVRECLYLEKRMLESVRKSKVSREQQDASVWATENFADLIHPLVKCSTVGQQQQQQQHNWQLWIHVEDTALQSTKWFAKKFGLDDEFGRRIERFKDNTIITIRTVSHQNRLYGKAVDEMGGIIFSLSEVRIHGTDDCRNQRYWKAEKDRLDKMTNQLLQYNPHMRVPFIFTYWPQTSSLEQAVQEVI
ncbi:SAC3/GANP/Nin1/mts3/eIF-3 p25 family-domain-containing protein [Zychaea mexicana]|uniref:SAC3/GANP/Nin1/mts3/eIF-3 p25 family-domain-containing protein n=1 Tax=Zychaea mexicana TaxID=64656 RepID=UPI0022FDF350|nr:SAC3/GANP/Nin1/mts3/eIF-3 p25 family-domain-containing protein [Zychaea mexicana]KAI9496070.1 SAC3/GANP/Nin1/mts3/eIF-3 p25 family-domain-containing protein [Zychaea mexicana]